MLLRNLLSKTQQFHQRTFKLTSQLLFVQARGIRDPPRFREEDIDKINKLELAAYFEDLMQRRPANESGYINLPRENFKSMVRKAKSEADLKTLVYAHANYIGHRNSLPHSYVDEMLSKALELGHPETMIETLRLHTELLYHPQPALTQKYFDFFASKGYSNLKDFYDAVKSNFYLVRPTNFSSKVIEMAFENKDIITVVDAYLLTLDYSTLSEDHLIKVYESQDFESHIDHGLYKHLNAQVEKRQIKNAQIKLNQALYNLKIKGYLTSADIIMEVGSDSQVTKIENSEFIKKELFDQINAQMSSFDSLIQKQLKDAIKSLEGKVDAEFYGLQDYFTQQQSSTQEEAVPDQVVVEEGSDKQQNQQNAQQ
ncbi:UNKNOWN [Stylonychia lemnae]|uniref:Uncharacterized protein n=1 Tax=Stylonychia lemnae TaxID=5949 RepID=A0A078AN92_STYLE|nr:UNKNOWN [Stylonychia lemnae]|eukprot:CDW83639.1 UNKNOWN [Stylonychia lemnae]